MKVPLKFFKSLLPARAPHKYTAVLSKIRLFHTLSRRELALIEPIIHERSYISDEVIFDEGEQGLGMYIILEGNVRIIRRGMMRGILGNREITTLGPGEDFGEMALLDGVKRSAAAVASGPTRLLSLFQPEFLRLLHTHHEIGFKMSYEMARIMAERLRETIERNPNSETV